MNAIQDSVATQNSPSALDETLARWRGDDASEHYWLAGDLGKAGLAPAVLPEIAQRLHERGKLDSFLDLFSHRSASSKVLTPPGLAGATARLLARSGCDRRALLGEVGALIAEDVRRKRLARLPPDMPGPARPAAVPGGSPGSLRAWEPR